MEFCFFWFKAGLNKNPACAYFWQESTNEKGFVVRQQFEFIQFVFIGHFLAHTNHMIQVVFIWVICSYT
jgi:hypothetical protein